MSLNMTKTKKRANASDASNIPLKLKIKDVKRRYRRGLRRYKKKTFTLSPKSFKWSVRYRQTVWRNSSSFWKIIFVSFAIIAIILDILNPKPNLFLIVVLLILLVVVSLAELWFAGGEE